MWVRPGYDLMGGLLHRPLAFRITLAALAATALLGWYVLLRRRLGPAALAVGALVWPALLGVVCAAAAPGASFLFALPALSAATGALLAMSRWPAVALTLGALVPAALLPALARNLFNGVGLAFGGAGAVCLVLFGLTLLPVIELLMPTTAGRATAAVPLTAAALSVALAGTGLAADDFDGQHPRRSHLAYVLDADSGEASWVSGEAEPTDWTREHVRDRDVSRLPQGYARGDLWTGPAEPMPVEGPKVEVRAHNGDTVTMHVTSRRSATSLVLRIDHRIDQATATAPGAPPATLSVTGARARTWPGEVRFRDLPPEGVEITVRTPGTSRIRVTAIDETHDLSDAPGFRPRPADTVASTREDGDLIAVARTYELRTPR
ncbi:hypothetical protein SUDANB95_02684 [Actinosynnema sp. ALI-1.44]